MTSWLSAVSVLYFDGQKHAHDYGRIMVGLFWGSWVATKNTDNS